MQLALLLLAGVSVEETRLPIVDDTGALLGAVTTDALVLIDPDDVPRRVCALAFGDAGQPLTNALPLESGALLVATFNGLVTTTDSGCTTTPLVTPFNSQLTLAVVRTSTGRLVVGPGAIGIANGISTSDDDGVTWDERLPPEDTL